LYQRELLYQVVLQRELLYQVALQREAHHVYHCVLDTLVVILSRSSKSEPLEMRISFAREGVLRELVRELAPV